MSSNDDKEKEKHHSHNHDRALFRKFCECVTPLKQNDRVIFKKPSRSKKAVGKIKHTHQPLDAPFHQTNQMTLNYSANTIEKVDAETVLHYSQPHLHRNLFRQMKRGTLSIEARLDLHQCTVNEALYQTTQFLNACLECRFKWVLIIHGKGRLSKTGGAMLKSFLNQWLKTQSSVLAFRSAHPKDGGNGALYVLLKLKKG